MTEAQIDYIFWRCIDILNYIYNNWFVLRTLKHISFRDRTTGFDTIVLYTVEI